MSLVSLCATGDRAAGVAAVIAGLGMKPADNPVRGKSVLLKPNLNTADEPPASTHNQTLEALIDALWDLGAASITLGERSWKDTRKVMDLKGLPPLLERKQVRALIFDELPGDDWVLIKKPDHHWPEGFLVARPMLEAECLVETCCLKTHQYGGVFTLSLKLAVGALPGMDQSGHMRALHSSRHQRRMIAEINSAFSPDLVVIDGVDAFVDGGPASGTRARGDVMLASADRVAIDAAGVACLQLLGANKAIMNTPIFAQEQIARAAQLGLGAAGPESIRVEPADPASADKAAQVMERLAAGKARGGLLGRLFS